jgi:5-methylcytosine-specific restriction protein A
MVSNTDCIDCMRERSARYNRTERVRERNRQYCYLRWTNNPEQHKANSRAEYWKRPENGRANSANARARAVGITEKISGPQIKLALERQGMKCFFCDDSLSDYYEVDHQIPLKLGGENDLANLQCLCRKCHRAKTTLDLRMAKSIDVTVL